MQPRPALFAPLFAPLFAAQRIARRLARLVTVALAIPALVAGCALGPRESGVNDPFEQANRARFDRNLALGAALAGDGGESGPVAAPLRRTVARFGDNLGIPGTVVNDVLQIRPDRAMENTLRFVINSTVGLGGLFDPAARIGLHGRHSDFGETLYRWGVGEGAYVVLPLLGPSTERDALGTLVDLALDPWNFYNGGRHAPAAFVAQQGGRLAGAAEYADILDANVIDTTDPYAQARLLHLQTRRYHLGAQAEEDIIDPYADF